MASKHRRTRPQPEPEPPPPPSETVDVNQVVAYNIREARLLRGWTQEDLAARLEHFSGTRLTQAGISSIERAWDGERPREFDAQEILIFALAFHLPIIWFLLPHPATAAASKTPASKSTSSTPSSWAVPHKPKPSTSGSAKSESPTPPPPNKPSKRSPASPAPPKNGPTGNDAKNSS